MVVRFVGVIRVPLCAGVSRVCPVCVPAPPGDFLRVRAEPGHTHKVPVPTSLSELVIVSSGSQPFHVHVHNTAVSHITESKIRWWGGDCVSYPFGSITESKIRWGGLCVNPE